MKRANNVNSKKVNIFDIQRFAIHDGPGIRTIVFMQGCPLHCLWCSNPESWEIKRNLMYIKSKCTKCGKCAKNCPVKAITISNDGLNINRNICNSCGACENTCLNSAFSFAGKSLTIDEILHTVLKDKAYYENSGGGITLSGGEPFVQHEALMEILSESKSNGLHTVVETTGHVDPKIFKKSIPLVDMYLFDIKHTDPSILYNITGAEFSLMINNLQLLTKTSSEKVVIRVPVVPGFNADFETINGIFSLAKEYQIKEVHLLPYHTLGKDKFSWLGVSYPYDDTIPMMTEDKLIPPRDYGRAFGLVVKIGG